jgi:hypothetical protein
VLRSPLDPPSARRRDDIGKAYFTTPDMLGEYLLMDYMQRKSKAIH